ncbi:unnamed protein product [Phaeothamnion confervicola]
MAQQNWRQRVFLLLPNGTLCYYENDEFEEVDFSKSPRGLLGLNDGDFTVSNGRADPHDTPTQHVLVVQGPNQRWKLCAESGNEAQMWREKITECMSGRGQAELSSAFGRSAPLRMTSEGSYGRESGEIVHDSSGAGCAMGSSHSGSRQHHRSSRLRGGTRSISRHAAALAAAAHQPSATSFAVALALLNGALLAARLAPPELLTWRAFLAMVAVVNWVVAAQILRGNKEGERVPLVHAADIASVRPAVKQWDKKPLTIAGPGGVAVALRKAGTSVRRFEGNPNMFDRQAMQATWCPDPGTIFMVRGKDYMSDRKKVLSSTALYELRGVDFFQTDQRVSQVAASLDMSALLAEARPSPLQDTAGAGIGGVPSLLVLNVQLPYGPAPSMVATAADGPGVQAVMYFRLTEETVAQLRDPANASEAVRLWIEYCQRAWVDDSFKGRFKCMVVVGNFETLGLSMFEKYNGKPTLINKSGTLYRGTGYLEKEINVHNFGFFAKKGLHTLQDRFKDMVLHVGFTIEGRSASELPENMLACAQLNFPTIEAFVPFDA